VSLFSLEARFPIFRLLLVSFVTMLARRHQTIDEPATMLAYLVAERRIAL